MCVCLCVHNLCFEREPARNIWPVLPSPCLPTAAAAVMLLGVLRDAATQTDQLAVVLRPTPDGIADPLFSELDGLL